ncbi:uncharacterized protein LOC125198231 [Salvia hispanica]|uniref:uncharacterized protein LOC125198231 n=1 Tax=Salvia hispanica TaxID=49212 RepID=UPI002009A431|nr:uncharacterized protein LOC125198231 [Salvia hispanica]
MDNRIISGEDAYRALASTAIHPIDWPEIAVQIAAEKIGDDEDFEFSLVRDDNELSAEDFVYDGQLGPIFPVFNRDLLLSDDRRDSSVQVPLSQLLLEDRRGGDGDPPSCSSSEADELESVPPGPYRLAAEGGTGCRAGVRREKPPGGRKGGFSEMGGAKRREGSLVFLTPKRGRRNSRQISKKIERKRGQGRLRLRFALPGGRVGRTRLCMEKQSDEQVDRKKSYLPYRQDLVGLQNAMG